MDLDQSAASLYNVNPLLRPPGVYLFQSPLRGAYLREGVFNLEKTMVSVLHKELANKVEKLGYKKLEVMQPRIKFQLVNKPSLISSNEVLQSWLINTVYHLLVKNN